MVVVVVVVVVGAAVEAVVAAGRVNRMVVCGTGLSISKPVLDLPGEKKNTFYLKEITRYLSFSGHS